MIKYIIIAFRNVIANKRRSLFIGLAISIGTIIMIMTASLSTGIRDNMIRNAFALFTGHVNIYGTDTVRGQDIMRIPNMNGVLDIVKKEIPSNSTILSRIYTGGKINNPNRSITAQHAGLMGMDIEKETLFKESITVIDGVKKDDGSIDIEASLNTINKKNYALIETNTAKKFDLKVGDVISFVGSVESELGIVKNTENFIVGAIIQGMVMSGGNFGNSIRVSNETVRNFSYMDSNQTSRMVIFINDKYLSNEYADNIEKALEKAGFKIKKNKKSRTEISNQQDTESNNGKFGSDFSVEKKEDGLELRVRTWQEEISFLEEMIRTIEFVAMILNIILMTIILIGISNTLIMSIRERTSEIGTLRAVGMQKPSVLGLFMLEGLILGLLGSIIGLVIGGSLAFYFSKVGIYIGPSPISIFLVNNKLYFKLTAEIILVTILAIICVSEIASFYPSYSAAKLKPVTAMQKD